MQYSNINMYISKYFLGVVCKMMQNETAWMIHLHIPYLIVIKDENSLEYTHLNFNSILEYTLLRVS